jgi:hypothetical protein
MYGTVATEFHFLLVEELYATDYLNDFAIEEYMSVVKCYKGLMELLKQVSEESTGSILVCERELIDPQ